MFKACSILFKNVLIILEVKEQKKLNNVNTIILYLTHFKYELSFLYDMYFKF